MENLILIVAAAICIVVFLVKPVRHWIAKAENYNSAIVLIAFFGIVVALPLFSKQINQIQVTVDSLQQSIKGIYSKYTLETFCYVQLKESFAQDKELGLVVRIPLKDKPIPFTINVWEGGMNVNPVDYKVDGNILVVQASGNAADLKTLCAENTSFGYTVTYIPDPVIATPQ